MDYTRLNNKGFTILEVMIAVMVLAIGLVGAAVMQVAAVNANTNAFRTTKATSLALDQIENILSWDSDDPRLTDNSALGAPVLFQKLGIVGAVGPGNTIVRPVQDSADFAIADDEYTIYYDCDPRFDPGNPAVEVGIDIQVFVVWTEGTNLKTVEMNFTKVR